MRFVSLSLVVALAAGCSAVTALAETRRAEKVLTLSEARAGDAPAEVYALTLSRAYLDKAREQASEAQYGSAVAYAKASRDAAEQAQRARSARHGAGSSALPTEDSP